MYYGSKKNQSTIQTYYEFWTKVKKNIMDLGERGIPSYFELHGKYWFYLFLTNPHIIIISFIFRSLLN